ncbi:ROK family transcriptional regulator [Bacillus sp. EB01]|uniref:ROK family transcriptional regulator n=1 Tax=Bacillus sp. EB01 TaxID=1347086 RepID=UPI000693EFFF|nr:ROK family transcriptional regulator [Bacillus sp. EB01]
MQLTNKQMILLSKILDTIYVKGPISRIEISKQTGITPATVSELTGHLLEDKLIYELGEDSSDHKGSGRKRIFLDISKDHSFYIGCELSEKYLSFCLSDNTGKIHEKKIIKLDAGNHSDLLTEEYFINELKQFILIYNSYQPRAIGIALPGHFNEKAKTIYSNKALWKKFNLGAVLNSFDLPIYFQNNVHCMANSERIFGGNYKDHNFIFFHVGRGMFCSYMYEGNTYGKGNFLVGEVGHTVVQPGGELCECGKMGCLQTYASEAWIIKKSRILFENSNTTFLRQLSPDKHCITIETILRAYKMGDEGVINILNNAIKYLSITINNLPMVIDTNKIILHGELFSEPELTNILSTYLIQNKILLPIDNKWDIVFKKYNDINGALAACSLAVSNFLLQH